MEKKSTDKKYKKKHADLDVHSDDQFMLSFEQFVAQRQTADPLHQSDEEDDLEMEIEKLDDEEVQVEGEQLEDDQQTHDFRNSGQGTPTVAVTPKAILKPTPTTTPRRQKVADTENLNVTEQRATYTLLHRVQAKQENLNTRMTKIEELLAGHSSSGEGYKLVWPVSTRTHLDQIEADLAQNARTRKALEKQFKRADRSALYAFLHNNLVGLLGGTGRWSWTGKPSQPKTYHNESNRSDGRKADDDEEAEDDEQNATTSKDPESWYAKSSPANSLRSVQLLHDVCYQLFQDVSDANIIQETRRALTNMNNAYQKRKMRAAADAGPSKRIPQN